MVGGVLAIKLSDGHALPPSGNGSRPCVDKRPDSVVGELVLEDDQARRLGAGDPLLEVRVELGARSAVGLADAPVLCAALMK